MSGTELGKAYVQIMPSAKGLGKGIEDLLNGEAGGAGEKAGGVTGSALISKLKGVIAAAGVGKIIQSALTAGGALQQSLGGIETLYGKSADTMKKYAEEAYKTTGLSANAYMEQVTSFSAGLIASMGGNTKGAAEVAHMAMVDMADNANKMGTSMESIQNAYQGFAKQNYTMLDNLKLGYGGTKSEMERLLADASALTGVKYDINHLDDVYTAIHVMQQQIGITGTTSAEAAETFTGSMAAMKASAENLLAYMTTGGDVTGALTTLLETAQIFLFKNMIPMLLKFAAAIPTALGTAISVGAPMVVNALHKLVGRMLQFLNGGGANEMIARGNEMISGFISGLFEGLPDAVITITQIITRLAEAIMAKFPYFIEVGFNAIAQFADGLLQNAPMVIANVGLMIANVGDAIMSRLPFFMEKGWQLVQNLAHGIVQNMPAIVSALAQVLARLVVTIAQNLPGFLQKGAEIIGKLVSGLLQAVGMIPSAIAGICQRIKIAFTSYDWRSIGRNIIDGISNGIKNAASNIVQAAKEAAKKALDAAKNFLGIHSPSRVFRDAVGRNISLGWAEGILAEEGAVENAMNALSGASVGMVDTGVKLTTSDAHGAQMVRLMSAMVELLEEGQTLEVNGRDFGRLVRSYA